MSAADIITDLAETNKRLEAANAQLQRKIFIEEQNRNHLCVLGALAADCFVHLEAVQACSYDPFRAILIHRLGKALADSANAIGTIAGEGS
jgi:hypothetical protein